MPTFSRVERENHNQKAEGSGYILGICRSSIYLLTITHLITYYYALLSLVSPSRALLVGVAADSLRASAIADEAASPCRLGHFQPVRTQVKYMSVLLRRSGITSF